MSTVERGSGEGNLFDRIATNPRESDKVIMRGGQIRYVVRSFIEDVKIVADRLEEVRGIGTVTSVENVDHIAWRDLVYFGSSTVVEGEIK